MKNTKAAHKLDKASKIYFDGLNNNLVDSISDKKLNKMKKSVADTVSFLTGNDTTSDISSENLQKNIKQLKKLKALVKGDLISAKEIYAANEDKLSTEIPLSDLNDNLVVSEEDIKQLKKLNKAIKNTINILKNIEKENTKKDNNNPSVDDETKENLTYLV
ncbi:hypothetical protein [Agathobacter rectalis]|uniref:hypothetical protein n=1 Tax=Agathobacter rectalis TaxID=39491 RepID=UPI0027D2C4BA|nr:hypothetical protein [Agathobacter rectalis]MCB7108791.1 hypothetical protein [Agathobacter rectalis]MCG4812084.1 hypothetical protein [Agathobacter rectalis]